MSEMPKVAVWDSNVIISLIQQSSDAWPENDRKRWTEIEPYLRAAESGEFKIVLPESVRAEVASLNDLDGKVDKAAQQKMIEDFFENPFLIWRSVSRSISEMAAKIGRTHEVKALGDKLVLATAVICDVPLIHTYDGEGPSQRNKKLLTLDGALTLKDGTAIEIAKPNCYSGGIFDPSVNPGRTKRAGKKDAAQETRPEAGTP